MTIEVQPFAPSKFILDKTIFGNVMEDAGMEAQEIEQKLQAAANMTGPIVPAPAPAVYYNPNPSSPPVQHPTIHMSPHANPSASCTSSPGTSASHAASTRATEVNASGATIVADIASLKSTVETLVSLVGNNAAAIAAMAAHQASMPVSAGEPAPAAASSSSTPPTASSDGVYAIRVRPDE